MQTTELEIKIPKNETGRAYIEFYINGERRREYNGKSIMLNLKPNNAKSAEKRYELLLELKLALAKHIKEDNYPAVKVIQSNPIPPKAYTLEEVIELALASKLKMKLSKRYKTDLTEIHGQLITFLNTEELEGSFDAITVLRLEEFLHQFNSSGTYYMKKRSDLAILLSAGAKLIGTRSKARETHTERAKAKLHKAYKKPEMKRLLDFLISVSKELHLCCLLTYGCWLRPHIYYPIDIKIVLRWKMFICHGMCSS